MVDSDPTSPAPTADTTAGPTETPDASESEVAEAAEDYYQAVDREDWAYTYSSLDASTRALGETLAPHVPQNLSPALTMLPHCPQ